MIVRIKYENPNQKEEYIIEELEDTQINIPEYCANLHKNHLCDTSDCDGEHCKIWMEFGDEFILMGVED